MKKTLKISVAAAILAIVVIGVAASFLFFQSGSLLPSGEPPQVQIAVSGDMSAPKTLTVKDIAQMPLCKVSTRIGGETATYVGVTVFELLNQTGVNWDVGSIDVASADGNSKTLNIFQAYNSTKHLGSEIILAIAKDGKWLTDASDGPFTLIAPDTSDCNVLHVAEIKLHPWVITVTGTSHTLAITGENIADYEVKTVTGPFVPGGGPERTSQWTGVSLWSVLQAAGLPQAAHRVTVEALDGYSREFSVSEVQSSGMLIGFQENRQYLQLDGGGPFRLFIPTDDMKWGQFWVQHVVQITVS